MSKQARDCVSDKISSKPQQKQSEWRSREVKAVEELDWIGSKKILEFENRPKECSARHEGVVPFGCC
eukprot:scaffold2744_cov136-Cylindrotheca_fusiformis.AAC.19